MSFETDLQKMGEHFVEVFRLHKGEIYAASGEPAYNSVGYGDPKVIPEWPYLSIQPQLKERELKSTRKFGLTFSIWIVLFHGQVASTLEIQSGAQERAEAIENFVHTDFRWNFYDSSDTDLDKVIFGYVETIDHPVVIAPENELWSSSRLVLRGMSEEVF